MKNKFSIALSLAIIMSMLLTSIGLASVVDVAVVDVTTPDNSVTIAAGGSGPIVINMSVTGKQEGTSTFEVNQNWTLSGGTFTPSNPKEFTVAPRLDANAAPTTFSTGGNIYVAADQAAGTFTLKVSAFDITNSNKDGAKLADGADGVYYVTVTAAPVVQNQSITVTTAAPASAVYGSTFPVAATASSGLPVAITTAGSCSGGGSGSALVTMTSGINTCTVYYNQAGNAGYYAAPEVFSTTTAQKADATVSVTGGTFTYDGQPHGATGTATGLGSANLSGLDLGLSFTNVPGGTANWSFTGGDNYADESGSVEIVITKAPAGCNVAGYTGTYDGNAHGASGTCSGGGTLDLGASFTNVPGGTADWSFTGDSNHEDTSGSVLIDISKANATINVTGYSGVYDGNAHGATGTATGVGGVDLSANLDLGASFTDVPGGNAHWTFAGGTNYNDTFGDVAIVISPAPVTATAGSGSGTYNGAAQSPSACVVSGAYTGDLACTNDPASVGPNVGTTAIAALVSGTGLTNYDITYVAGAYTINPAPVTATAGSGSSTYDGTVKSPSACAVSGAYTGDLACANDPASVGPNAGTTAIAAAVSGTGLTNYDISYVAGSYTINQAPSVTTVTCAAGPFYFTGAEIKPCTAVVTGAGGLNQVLTVNYTNNIAVGSATASATYAGDLNHTGSTDSKNFTISAWTLNGFFQPVDMNGVYNVVKNGSTVPLKFDVFSGANELTSVSAIKSFTVKQVACVVGTPMDDVELVTTGGTTLRYDTVGGQFIQNWQTPKSVGSCYQVTMTTQDLSTIVAFFKLK